MQKKYLRNKADGFIYEWHPILAANPKCEEVSEEEAYPERFVDTKQVKRVKARQKQTKKKLDLSTELPGDGGQQAPAEVGADASRGLKT